MQRIVPLLLGAFLIQCAVARGADAEGVEEARSLLRRGRYAEAAERFEQLKESAPAEAALGLAQAQGSMGQSDKSLATLQCGIEVDPKSAPLRAELAWRLLECGRYDDAQEAAEKALALDENSTQARWVIAELDRLAGRIDEANAGYEWFIEHYNNRQDELAGADDYCWIGLGAAQFARWNRLTDEFRFLVNTLYPDALQRDENFWQAHYATGRLFLEKYNEGEATRSFDAALKINPNAAEVHAAVAELALQDYELDKARRSIDRALEINPSLAEAWRLLADLHVANFDMDQAFAALEKARATHPRAEETLGRLAAAHILANGMPEVLAGTEPGKVIAEVEARNPRAGVFYSTLAATLDRRRKFDLAAEFYRQAVEKLPQMVGPRGELGLLYMRLGDEVQAKKLLDESFEIDPFNVRVKNSLEVLDVLAGYATIETEHFIVKFDRGHDEILARYAARYLEEEVYPELCERFDFEPEGKTLFEIFNRARNSSGHAWFSARMVGLPYVGTVGACAGRMVALASPSSLEEPYNWARVLKHEFVHVLNLQQTRFNIPHWFTEALAVLSEGYPRPEMWNQLLAARVPAGEVFTLEDINLGFIRPKSGADWHMAYCQSELYAQYMLATYGEDALAKMLQAYADNLSTPAALKRCFDVELDDFEREYSKFLKETAAEISAPAAQETEFTFAQLQRAVREKPDDPKLLARLAYEQLRRQQYAEARRLAKAALEKELRTPLASYVVARIHLLVGEGREALEALQGALDPQNPHDRVLALLAALKLKLNDTGAAERLYQMGRQAHPHDSRWPKALASLYLKTDQTDKLADVLRQMAEGEADNLLARKKLAQMALAQKDYTAALDWANQANQIDVQDAEAHQILGEALLATEKPVEAVEEFEIAIRLDSEEIDLRLALARAQIAAQQEDAARETLNKALKLEPDNGEARRLLEELEDSE